jgi:hypothetical protein
MAIENIQNPYSLGFPTQVLLASLNNLQSLPIRASMEAKELASKLISVSIALKVQKPDIGNYVNLYM